MNKEILLVAQMVANEKSVDAFTAIEAALATITASKIMAKDADIRVSVDRRTGSYKTFRRWEVISDADKAKNSPLEVSASQMALSEAILHDANLKVGDTFEAMIPSINFSRIDAHIARQVISREIRKAERAKILQAYEKRIGEALIGTVRRISREGIVLELAPNIEAFLPREAVIPREEIRLYDRLRVYLYEVAFQGRGPQQLLVSRTSPRLLEALFKIKITEVETGVIEIKRVARDPGVRAKVAVKTNDGRIDPIGMCIGMRGERVQSISNELNGEHIDIILWADNPAQLVINALAPAEVASITIDEDARIMDVAVKAENLPRAIGRNGQNVRLASELTGWILNIMSVEEAAQKTVDEAERLESLFKEQLEIDEAFAKLLVKEGFSSLEEIAYIPFDELAAISNLEKEQLENLRSRAKDILLAEALSNESSEEAVSESSETDKQSLDSLPGLDESLKMVLISKGIATRESLAELAIDDLLEITSLTQAQAGQLIMAARAHWFKEH